MSANIDSSIMEERHQTILHGLVEAYIRTGEPVGSTYLKETLKLDISPATVRSILRNLEETGFITQPHTSAGRIPTDAGYRHYVDYAEGQPFDERQMRKLAANYRKLTEANPNANYTLPRMLSELSHALAVTGRLPSGEVTQSGMREVVKEDSQAGVMQEVSDFVDNIYEYLETLADLNQETTNVFIGEENPVIQAQHTSMIVKTVETSKGQKVILVIVGPKRMPYAKNVSLIDTIAKYLN